MSVMNGRSAVMTVGFQFPYGDVDGVDRDPETGVVTFGTSIKRTVLGLQMGITPQISRDGNVTLNKIDPIHRKATTGLMIGDKTYWGQGIAVEAWALVCGYGFQCLGLGIDLDVFAFGQPGGQLLASGQPFRRGVACQRIRQPGLGEGKPRIHLDGAGEAVDRLHDHQRRSRGGVILSRCPFRNYRHLFIHTGFSSRICFFLNLFLKESLSLVKASSGYEILDNQALDMVKKAKPLTPIPAALRGREFTVDIPVIFDLQAG